MLFICKGVFQQEKGILFESSFISQMRLDDEQPSLSQTHVMKLQWTSSHLIRLLDNHSVLVNHLVESVSPSLQLWNNQFKFTRKLQSYLKTAPQILDIAIYEDQLLFIYNTLEVQLFSLSLQAWIAFHPLSLYATRSISNTILLMKMYILHLDLLTTNPITLSHQPTSLVIRIGWSSP